MLLLIKILNEEQQFAFDKIIQTLFWNFVFFEVTCISFANLNKHFYINNSKFFKEIPSQWFHLIPFKHHERVDLHRKRLTDSIYSTFLLKFIHFTADLWFVMSGKLIANVETVWSIRSNQHIKTSFSLSFARKFLTDSVKIKAMDAQCTRKVFCFPFLDELQNR